MGGDPLASLRSLSMERFSGDGERLLLVYRAVYVEVDWVLTGSGETRRVCHDL